MKKQLFYNFYVTRENFDGIINNIHYKCLEYYKHIFDEVFICITLNDLSDNELVLMVQNKFIQIFNGVNQKITFKVTKNDPHLREVVFFYNEIIEKLNELDLVFFAHNKGTTNIENSYVNKESLFYWIIALYYSSLYNYENGINMITSNICVTYGSCYTTETINEKTSFSMYAGTFYWMNCKRIYTLIKDEEIEIPKLSNRFIAESFPNIINKLHYNTMSSLRNMILLADKMCVNWYLKGKEYCELLGYLTDDFYKLYNLVIKEEYFI